MGNKNFIIIVIGQVISLFGNAILRFSMSLYILDITGSAGIFSTILAISTIPYVLFAPLAGYLADTINKKKIMASLDFISGALIGVYSLIIIGGTDSIIITGLIMFILSIIYTLYAPAVTSSIPLVVKKDRLSSANGIVQQVTSVVNILGPVVAGVLYSFAGVKIIVIVSAISFTLAGILELFLVIPDIKGMNSQRGFLKGSFVDMKNTFIYLKRYRKVILGFIASYAMANIFVVPILSIIAPYFIKIRLSLPATAYGFAEAVFVVGMIISGLLVTFNPKMFKVKNIYLMILPMVIGILIMTATSLEYGDKMLLVGIFSIGGMGVMLSIGLTNITSLTYIQNETPRSMLGKVSAFSTAVAATSVAPGQIVFGTLINTNIPIFIILIISFLLCIALALYLRWVTKYIK